jgi:hypothetical protein
MLETKEEREMSSRNTLLTKIDHDLVMEKTGKVKGGGSMKDNTPGLLGHMFRWMSEEPLQVGDKEQECSPAMTNVRCDTPRRDWVMDWSSVPRCGMNILLGNLS